MRSLKRADEPRSGPAPPAPSPELLAAIAGAFDPVWAETPGEERRLLVNAGRLEIPVLVVPGPPRVVHERRVLPVVYQPWLARLLPGGE